MSKRENAGKFLRRLGLALIAAMVFIVMVGAGKVYADTTLTEEWLAQNSYKLTTDGTYNLESDITLPQSLTIVNKNVTLNLNGHTLSMSDMNAEGTNKKLGSVIYIIGGKLTINGGGDGDNRGKITGGFGNNYAGEDNESTEIGGTEGGIIKRGGGLAISSAEVVLNHVEISSNLANYGAGIYMNTLELDGLTEPELTLDDCLIKENKLRYFDYEYCDGAAIYCDGGSINMIGGAITLNDGRTTDQGIRDGGWGGIFYAQTSKRFTVSGNAMVFTNYGQKNGERTYNNFRFGPGNYGGTQRTNLLSIGQGGLGADAKFGVYMEAPGIFTTVNSVVSPDQMTKFYSDRDDCVIIRNTDGSLELKLKSEIAQFYTVTADNHEYDRNKHGVEIILASGVNADTYFGESVENLEKKADHKYEGYKNAGTYTVHYQIVPQDTYPWVLDSVEVKVTQRDLTNAKISLKSDVLDYNRAAQEPELSVKDFDDEEDVSQDQYLVSYKDKDGQEIADKQNVKMPGDYTIVITAATKENYSQGTAFNYKGQVEIPFKIVAPVPEFYEKCSLTLGGSIGVKFFIDIPDKDYYDYSDSAVVFNVENEVKPDKTRTIPFDRETATKVELNQKQLYEFICYVNSVQMADKITVTFNYKFEDEDKEITTEYSVKAYVDKVATMGNDEYPEKARALVESLADYGHYVQPYLSELRGWNISSHTLMDTHYKDSYDETEVKAAKTALTGKEIVCSRSSRIAAASYSLYLDTDTAIYLYFLPATGYTGGAEATINGINAKVYKTSDGYFKVEVPKIGAHLLGTTFNVVLNNENYTTTADVSAMSYVKAILESSTNEKEVKAMMALYNYYAKAMKYLEA